MSQEIQFQRELQKELEAIYLPHTTTLKKPPFTVDQLIVMAVVVLGYPSGPRIQRWISDNFRYYEGHDLLDDSAASAYRNFRVNIHGSKPPSQYLQRSKPIGTWRHPKRRATALIRANLPIKKCYSSTAPDGWCCTKESTWSITSAAEARCFLQELLWPGGKWPVAKRCNFFDLSPELRNMIYRLVLLYPETGVCITSWAPLVLSCEPDANHNVGSWLSRASRFSRFSHGELPNRVRMDAPLKTHLAILAVNKQLHREATSVFYGYNTFVCIHPSWLCILARSQHVRLIRRVLITLLWADFPRCWKDLYASRNTVYDMFNLWSGLLPSCHLVLLMDDSECWNSAVWRCQPHAYELIQKDAGVRALVALLSKANVSFEGPCKRAAKALEDAIAKQRLEDQANT